MTNDETAIGRPVFGQPPFGEPMTFRRPNPGGHLTAEPVPVAGDSGEIARLLGTLRLDRLNPIVAGAAPLLNLAAQMRRRLTCDDVEGLRLRVMQGVEQFERRVAPLGLPPRSVRAGKYAICATLDDLALNTPWGSRSVWTTRSLVGTFFSETWGGDRFFDLLAQIRKDPGINIDLIELLYCCISLGFEGKYRVDPRGGAQLHLLRDDLYRLIRLVRGDAEGEISPHWRGVPAAYRGLGAQVPHWVVGVTAAGAMLAVYATLLFLINGQSDQAYARLANLPPNGAITLARVAPPPPPPPPVAPDQLNRLRAALEPETRSGEVTVLDDAQTITLRIVGQTLFAPGSADLRPEVSDLLARIGVALDTQPGRILVTGHTDSQPIHTLRFPSNYDLSLARARAVATTLEAAMRDPSRVSAEGRADTEPVAPNTTEGGRQQNRRVDLIITKTG